MVKYRDVIEAAVQRQIEISGASFAIRQARKVPELTLDDDGHVEDIDGDPELVFRQVVEKYEEASGPVAAAIIATALQKQFGEELNELDLPEEILEHV